MVPNGDASRKSEQASEGKVKATQNDTDFSFFCKVATSFIAYFDLLKPYRHSPLLKIICCCAKGRITHAI